MNHRQERVSEAIKRTLSELLVYETQDPRLVNVRVTRVDITGDLRRATIYVLPTETPVETAEILTGLGHARPYFRHRLAERLQLRFAPELTFEVDREADRAGRVDHLLDELDPDLKDKNSTYD